MKAAPQSRAIRATGLGRRILLGLQLGICFIVLVCCGLLTRTALNIVNRATGFDRANCLTGSVALSRSGYTEQRGLAFQAALLDRMRSAPGVASATLTSHLPMGDDGAGNTRDFSIPGYVPAKGEEMAVVTDFEGPDFFHIMGIAMRQGREFDTHDNATAAAGGRHQRIDGASLLAERQCGRQQRDGRPAPSPDRRHCLRLCLLRPSEH